MAWYDVPLSTDPINLTQPTIQSNFQTIQNDFNINHITLGAGSDNDGKHKYLQMPNLSDAEIVLPETGPTETALYCDTSSYTGRATLLFKPQDDAAAYDITTQGSYSTEKWTILPSGLLIKWGTYLWSYSPPPLSSSPFEYTYEVHSSVPKFSACYHVFLQIYKPSSSPVSFDAIITLNDILPDKFVFGLGRSSNPRILPTSININFMSIGIPDLS